MFKIRYKKESGIFYKGTEFKVCDVLYEEARGNINLDSSIQFLIYDGDQFLYWPSDDFELCD